MTPIEALIAFLTSGTAVGLIGFVKWYLGWRRKHKAKEMPNLINIIVEIYREMNTLLQESGGQRVSLMRAENGGEIPVAGKTLYASSIYEVFDGPVGPTADEWVKQRLDQSYLAVLLEASVAGQVLVKTTKLRNGILKDFNDAHNVATSHVVAVRSIKGAFYYLVVDFSQDIEPTPEYRNAVRVAAGHIAKLLSEGGS